MGNKSGSTNRLFGCLLKISKAKPPRWSWISGGFKALSLKPPDVNSSMSFIFYVPERYWHHWSLWASLTTRWAFPSRNCYFPGATALHPLTRGVWGWSKDLPLLTLQTSDYQVSRSAFNLISASWLSSREKWWKFTRGFLKFKTETMKVDEFRDQGGFYWGPKGWKNINSAESSSLGEVQHLLFLPAPKQKYVQIDTLQICPIPWSVRSPSRDLRWHDPPNRFLAAFPACTRQPSCLGERKGATVGTAEVSFSACQVGVIKRRYIALKQLAFMYHVE